MQRMNLAILTLCTAGLLFASTAHAQDNPSNDKVEGRGPPKKRVAEHVERAGAELKQAGEVAGAQARDAVHEARSHADEALREAREGANEALEEARKQAATSAQEAERAAEEAREKARSGVELARERASTFLEEAREHVRRVLLSAAASLESKDRKEARETARAERQDAARKAQWRAWQARVDAQGATVQPDLRNPAVRTELKLHARRTARLARVRALADQNKDTASVLKCDALLAKELARHDEQMNRLLNRSGANPVHQPSEATP